MKLQRVGRPPRSARPRTRSLDGALKSARGQGELCWRILLADYLNLYAPPLYFLVSLFLLRLAPPELVRLVNLDRRVALLAGVACVVLYRGVLEPSVITPLRAGWGQDPVAGALWGVQYFVAGLALTMWEETLQPKASVIACACLTAAAVLRVFPVALPGAVVQYLYLVGLYLLFLGVRTPVAWLSAIGANTMGIYLLHAPVALKAVSPR